MTTSTNVPTKTESPDLSILFAAIAEADAGDQEQFGVVKTMLRDAPKVARPDDLAYNAEARSWSTFPPGQPRLFRSQMRRLRVDLMQEGTGSALERMLIRRIGLDYLATLRAERVRAIAQERRGVWS